MSQVTRHRPAMKSLFVRVLFILIQLIVVSVAADQIAKTDSGSRSRNAEDDVHSCSESQNDLVANSDGISGPREGGCDSASGQHTWKLSEAGSWDPQLSQSESARPSISKFAGPKRWSSRRLLVGMLLQKKVSTEAHTDMSLTVAHEERKSKSFQPGVMAAGFFGSFLISCAVICPCWRPRRRMDHDTSIEISHSLGPSYTSSMSNSAAFSPRGSQQIPERPGGALTFTMAELIKITGNFSPSHKIGQGGFGTVYKGTLRDGRDVAVKRAKKDTFEARLSLEFKNELDMLSQVDHLNLVKLIGYLEEAQERIIVVEFVPNGNLREHLDGYSSTATTALDISTRLDIAIDVAHALTYLHMYAERPIIHRDVKATNILLTDTFRAKVADFGFSRMGPTDQGATHVSTQVKGTAGYLDPEYLTTYQLNQKSDVYSFGILLVEIFTGRRPIELKRPSDERVTIRWAFKKFVEGKVLDILDPRLEKTPAVQVALEKIADLAFACSAPTKNDRPTMKKASESLWQIRKEYRGPVNIGSPVPSSVPSTPQAPSASPSPNVSHLSRATYPIPESDTPNSSMNSRGPYRTNAAMYGSQTPSATPRPLHQHSPLGTPTSQNGNQVSS